MKNLFSILFVLFCLSAHSQQAVRHAYGIDTTIVQGVEKYALIDTSFFNVFRGGQQKFSITFEPVDSIQQITNFFEGKIESDFREGISGIERVVNLNSAIRTFVEFNPTYQLLTGTNLTRYFGLKYGSQLEGSYTFTNSLGVDVAVTITPINELGNYRLVRTSDSANWVLIPLPNNTFWINNFDIGNGVNEPYFFKKYGGEFVPFESFFNKYARAKIK